jgi:hypothetical protein
MIRNSVLLTLAALMGANGIANATSNGERVTYENTIRPLMDRQCAECHGKDSPAMEEFDKNKERYKKEKKGPRMTTYEELLVFVNGADTGALMRRLDEGANTKEGKPGNMYKNLGETDAERAANLTLFKQWVSGWTLKRTKEITPDERTAILAPRG